GGALKGRERQADSEGVEAGSAVVRHMSTSVVRDRRRRRRGTPVDMSARAGSRAVCSKSGVFGMEALRLLGPVKRQSHPGHVLRPAMTRSLLALRERAPDGYFVSG